MSATDLGHTLATQCLVQRSTMLCCYAFPTQCPVLTYSIPLPGAGEADGGTAQGDLPPELTH
eukprot:3870349-Rhodomonas_salina.1